ncbi:34-kDa subunit of RNA polymerase III (C) [Coemansia aciculifera]|uniref:34-kDa subunit of RNA polymerase III (C) n=1 Tax=Coemansia aciculifera TaxID=417176 RepID=A0ACC1LUW0_9FUNG|nr:34-kDa subunit of RNA polymerase III (C) [Coemansia aciculifera]KAJ2910980.1 34-kDa subunit of RNA polymerase III (C) [Coemansia aciculifera]
MAEMADAQLDSNIYEMALRQPEGVDANFLEHVLPGHPPLETIVNSVNRLLSNGQLELVQVGTRIMYRGITQDELTRMSALSADEKLVYKHIENSGNEGIWVRTIKQKTNLLQGVITRCLKVLEQKVLIKSIKSVKHPTRKLYMLVDVSPSTDITGGPWYTDQEMDTDFIEQLSKRCYQFIFAQSFPRHNQNAVFSANHRMYPKCSQIKNYITAGGITDVPLTVDHIEELLTMLVYDGKIERIAPATDIDMGGMGGGRSAASAAKPKTDWMYRALRITNKDSPFTDIPCGRCPVYERCSDTGAITPAKCEYFKTWLAF